MATKSVLKKKRPAAFPISGFVSFNWRNSSLGSEVAFFKDNKIRLTEQDKEKLNLAMRMANRRGFMFALICPKDGSVVETNRGSDLPDGMLARCPQQGCGKEWMLDASS